MADVKFSQFTVGNEMMVGDQPVGLRPTSPTNNYIFNFPGAGIRDSSGNYLFEYSSPGSLAVNHLKFESSLTGNSTLITAVGGDPNINISLLPPGTGALILDNLKWPTSDGAPNTFLFTDGSGNLGFTGASVTTSVTGTARQVFANGTFGAPQFGDITLTLPQDIATISSPSFNNVIEGYTTTVTAAATTTLTVTSTYQQFFTGATTQTVLMPVVSTLTLGQAYYIVNNSSGNVTVQSSGANNIQMMAPNTFAIVTCILTSGTTAASWSAEYVFNGGSGTVNAGTINDLAYYAASGTAVSALATVNSASLVTTNAGVPTWAAMTNGQLIIGNTGGTPIAATLTAGTNVTITNAAGSITINAAGSGVTPAALTKTDDTNVTLTLGGTPASALLQATSLTLGWTGQLALTRGGTNASLTASNGGIVYSTASALAILAATATANQILLSGSSTAPAWSTTTYPSTNAINTIMYASSANVLGVIAAANSSVLLTNSTGVPAWSGALTNGQLIIGSTGATPVASTLTAGANISIVNAAGTITISATGLGGFSWTVVTGTSQAMASDNGYIANNAGLVTLTLPAVSLVGDEIDIIGKGTGGWKVQCGLAQTIVVGSSTTSSAGSVASTNAKDAFYMICTVANTEWTVASAPQSSGLTIA